ncbi:hypothetical protein DFH09DRAFT_1321950 [Mycena vulgaris]|nr:hypothetical protein DFH09DRAFT_1321950 [Mycena vulgaris]
MNLSKKKDKFGGEENGKRGIETQLCAAGQAKWNLDDYIDDIKRILLTTLYGQTPYIYTAFYPAKLSREPIHQSNAPRAHKPDIPPQAQAGENCSLMLAAPTSRNLMRHCSTSTPLRPRPMSAQQSQLPTHSGRTSLPSSSQTLHDARPLTPNGDLSLPAHDSTPVSLLFQESITPTPARCPSPSRQSTAALPPPSTLHPLVPSVALASIIARTPTDINPLFQIPSMHYPRTPTSPALGLTLAGDPATAPHASFTRRLKSLPAFKQQVRTCTLKTPLLSGHRFFTVARRSVACKRGT